MQQLKDAGLRAEVDDRSEKLGYKLREARLQKVPYLLVIGDKEAEEGTIAVRRRGSEESNTMTVEAFLDSALADVQSKVIW